MKGKVIWKPTRCNNNSFIDFQWSAQHVSGNLLPIFRSARLRFFTYAIVSCCCGRQGFGARQRGTTCTVWRKLLDSSSFFHTVHIVPRCRTPNPCLPQQQDTIPYVVKETSVLRSWRWAKVCPKHVELILEINKTVIVASSWFLYYLTCQTFSI